MLSDEQVQFFRREGYLTLRGVLDPHLVRRARDFIWSQAPPDLQRDDPSSWPGTFRAEDGTGDWRDVREETIWRYRAPCREEWMLRLLAEHPPVRAAADRLLGAQHLPPQRRSRGFLVTRPETGHRRAPRQCHVDKHPFHLGVCGYLDDVAPGGGALAVWPGSHRAFYPLFRSRYLFVPEDGYEPLVLELDGTPPVDCHGTSGDVVFFHHRIAHKAGHNDSERVRIAVFHDYARGDLMQKLFLPPGDEMWEDWADELRDEARP